MRRALLAAGAVGVLLATAGCGTDARRDVEGVPSHDAQAYYLINNVDGHPNLVRVCQDGVAFVTTTREYNAVTLVPEWNRFCPPPKSPVLNDH